MEQLQVEKSIIQNRKIELNKARYSFCLFSYLRWVQSKYDGIAGSQLAARWRRGNGRGFLGGSLGDPTDVTSRELES